MLEQNIIKPLYQQLIDAIIENIKNGTYKAGDNCLQRQNWKLHIMSAVSLSDEL